MAKKFEVGVHDEEDSFTDPYYDREYSRDNVEWLAAQVCARFCCVTRCKVEKKIGRRRQQ